MSKEGGAARAVSERLVGEPYVAALRATGENAAMLSVEAIAPLKPLALSRRDYARLAEGGAFQGRRVQLIGGTVIAMSPMGTEHAFAIAQLTGSLSALLVPLGFHVRCQLPLAIGDDSEPEPDFAIVPAATSPGEDHPATALLVIEVADSSLRLDLGVKATLYATARVPEYWVIDLAGQQLVVHRAPKRGRYTSVRRHAKTARVESAAVPGVTLRLADLLP